MPEQGSALVAARVGAFVVGPRIGDGGSAQVFAGRHERTGLDVAIKVLNAADTDAAQRSRDEAWAVAQLDHPHIVRIFDQGRLPDGRPWIVMERVSGGSARNHKPRNFRALALWLVELLDALGHAHARSVLHLDLNPANVLIATRRDLRPGTRLADFGVSAVRGSRVATAGTLPFMAPEQFDPHAPLGRVADLYGFGCLAWALATGEPPFRAEHVPGLVYQKIHAPLPSFVAPFTVPEGFESWLHQFLKPDPGERWACAADAQAALVALPGPILRRPPPFPRDWRPHGARARPPAFEDAGLGLAPLRRLPLVGRESAQDRLFACAGRTAELRVPGLVALTGAVGVGKGALSQWLVERCEELGAALTVYGSAVDSALAVDDPAERACAVADTFRPRDGRALSIWVISSADNRALDVVQRLLRIEDLPVLTVLTVQPETVGGQGLTALLTHPKSSRIDLDALPEHELRHWIADHLGLRGPVVDRIAELSGGLPLTALQLVRSWVEDGRVEVGPEGWRLVDPSAPADLIAAVCARLPRSVTQGGATPSALAAAAVLAPPVDRADWLRLCAAVGIVDAEEAVDAARRAGLLTAGQHSFRWAHGVVREALLTTLTAQSKAALHRLAATHLPHLPPELLGVHWLDAGEPMRAIDPLRRACVAAVDASDHRAAFRVLGPWRRAVELCGAPPDLEAALLVQEATVLRALTRFSDAETCARRGAELARTLSWRALAAAATLELGRCALNVGRHQDAVTDLRLAHVEARAVGDTWTAAAAARMAGLACSYQGRHEEATTLCRWAYDAYAAMNEDVRAAWAAVTASQVAKQEGRLDVVEQWLRVAERHSRKPGSRAVRAEIDNGLGEVLRLLGRPDEAMAHYERALAFMVASGGTDRAVVEANLGLLLLRRGSWVDARLRLLPARDDFFGQRRRDLVALMDLALACVAAGLGSWSDWDEHFAHASQSLVETGFLYYDVADIAEFTWNVLLQRGEVERARQCFALAEHQYAALKRWADLERLRSDARRPG